MSEEGKNKYLDSINILPITDEPEKKPFVCFDVNDDGMIAIGQDTLGTRKTICIYSKEGAFQYGYTFTSYGSFGVEWDGENLNIYFVRSSKIVLITPEGEVLDVVGVLETIENNSYMNYLLRSKNRTVGETEYSAGNDMGVLNVLASAYSQIGVKDDNGNENVIYDVNSMLRIKIIVITLVFGTLALITVVRVLWQFNQRRRAN